MLPLFGVASGVLLPGMWIGDRAGFYQAGSNHDVAVIGIPWQSTGYMSMSTKIRGVLQTGAGIESSSRTKKEPPHNVILHNSWHPVSWVVYALKKSIPGMTLKKATRVMWTAHRELAELYEERLKSKGLTASVEKAD